MEISWSVAGQSSRLFFQAFDGMNHDFTFEEKSDWEP